MNTPDPINAVVDHDAGTVTVAITFRWDQGRLCLDKCEAGSFLGSLRRSLVAELTQHNGWAAPDGPITGFSYQCWEPDEERQLGYLPDYGNASCTECGQPARILDAAPWFEHCTPTACYGFLTGDAGVNFANADDVQFPIQER